MKIMYFGSGEFGLPTLERLAREHEVVAVVTQPDRPAGRGGELTPTPIAQWTAKRLSGVALIKPERVGDAGVTAELRAIAAGHQAVYVVIAFGQKMPHGLLDGVFAINLHASLLPRWRGAAPINAAILAGDRVTGNSVITLADRMDAGLVLGQTTQAIDPEMTAGELHDVLSAAGPELVMDVLRRHEEGSVEGRKQDETLVTKAGKLSKKDGVVDFSRSAEECRRRVHGLTPWPGVSVMLGGETVKVLRVRAEEENAEACKGKGAGALLSVEKGTVACGAGTVLRLLEVQPAGKRAMEWGAFSRGRALSEGMMVSSGT